MTGFPILSDCFVPALYSPLIFVSSFLTILYVYLSTISQLRLLLRGPRHSARSWCGRSLNTSTESLPNILSNTWRFHMKYREIGIPSYFPQSYLRGLSSGYVLFYSSFTATTPSLLFPVCYPDYRGRVEFKFLYVSADLCCQRCRNGSLRYGNYS